MKNNTLNTLINLRGLREQAFQFAFNKKGGMRQCYTRGCTIKCPMEYALKGVDMTNALAISRMHYGEDPVNLSIVYWLI